LAIQPRVLLFWVLFGSAISTAGALGWIFAKQSSISPQAAAPVTRYDAPVSEKREVALYFGDATGRFLSAEQRVLDQPADAAAAARRLVEVLIQGPVKAGTRTLPADAGLRALFVTAEGVAYIDFNADAFDHHPGGIETELLSIYSIVNTLVLNLDAIRQVKFLVDGQEAVTLAGHVDLSRPFQADMLWVR
jgi:spore germination protein GerM